MYFNFSICIILFLMMQLVIIKGAYIYLEKWEMKWCVKTQFQSDADFAEHKWFKAIYIFSE